MTNLLRSWLGLSPGVQMAGFLKRKLRFYKAVAAKRERHKHRKARMKPRHGYFLLVQRQRQGYLPWSFTWTKIKCCVIPQYCLTDTEAVYGLSNPQQTEGERERGSSMLEHASANTSLFTEAGPRHYQKICATAPPGRAQVHAEAFSSTSRRFHPKCSGNISAVSVRKCTSNIHL